MYNKIIYSFRVVPSTNNVNIWYFIYFIIQLCVPFPLEECGLEEIDLWTAILYTKGHFSFKQGVMFLLETFKRES